MSALAGALALVWALTGSRAGPGAVPRAAAQSAIEMPTPQVDASVPASDVTMIGATPQEPGLAAEADETWGIGKRGTAATLVRYRAEAGWTLGGELEGAGGEVLTGFSLDGSPLAAQMTPRGFGAMVGSIDSQPAVLVREPGQPFVATAPVATESETPKAGEEPLLRKDESLFDPLLETGTDLAARAPLVAPLEEAGGGAGALIVPVLAGAGVEDQVLHWDGHSWTSEPIAIPKASLAEFRVLGIGASSPTNAWLLAQLSDKAAYPAGAVALFRRVREGEGAGAKWNWQPVTPTGKGEEAEPLTVPLQGAPAVPLRVAGEGESPRVVTQVLTVTSEGVWVDGERGDLPSGGSSEGEASTTLFFKPEGARGGAVQRSWCQPAAGAAACERELPEALPATASRSIAWSGAEVEPAHPGQFGARVISGLTNGVSLRLRGETFERVLALGAGKGAEATPGAEYGAAFSNPGEGWLGASSLPVHLTVHHYEPSHVTPWQVPFRHPLLAIAPQPGATPGALTSEALAVGDVGAVARFKPGEGWLPESLFGPGERVETPSLRAVAWPTPSRAFAVGDEGAMWLWRAETGLWERDPATPLNFRGNLLGIAFDPGNPAYGFAVGSPSIGEGASGPGEPGVLLRYGKTWTQEADLPEQVRSASFTSIAFAGSEAIATYLTRPSAFVNNQIGGVLVKTEEKSPWEVDQQAAAAIGAGTPTAVAGLPDGGAALLTGGAEGRVYERETAGAAWQPTAVPLPSGTWGSLALFREGGALRALVTGGGVEDESEALKPPPGFPPNYLPPLPLADGGPQSDTVLRQSAEGWSDQTHEQDPAEGQPGNYVYEDLPYRPDPTLALMVEPNGGQGWAVGGVFDSHNERLETSSVERYVQNPAESQAPLGVGASKVPLKAEPTFAVGGGAACAAPCADRARAGTGPQVWLSSALALAKRIGVRAFLYTGPGVTRGEVNGPREFPIPYEHELAEYEAIMAGGGLPAYSALAPEELDARPEADGDEADLEQAFAPFPAPLGAGAAAPELAEAPEGSRPERTPCAHKVGCEAAYYAIDSAGPTGTVRLIFLDDSGEVEPTQLEWLRGQLTGAARAGTPAIVLGNADLEQQIHGGSAQAAEVARVLLDGGHCVRERAASCPSASAYFYDAPEEDVSEPLDVGEESIPTFGSGTLGYIEANNESFADFHGASGILLAQVEVAARNSTDNRAPVTARLIPDIGELALEAKQGLLLRRSNPAQFAGLARRPRAGTRSIKNQEELAQDPYIPIPENCVGEACAKGLFPEYTFSSSDEEVGQFVAPNLAAIAANPLAVLQGPTGRPVPDPQSDIFCPYNAGTTTVTIEAGGLAASLKVTVQPGSVREPCGTVPLKNPPQPYERVSATPPPPPTQPANGATPTSAPVVPLPPPPLPAVPAIPPAPVHAAPPPAPRPFFASLAVPLALAPFVPPPLTPEANPTPPSGTSAVTSPVEAAQKEEEEEEATESVSNQAVAYRAPEHEPSPAYILGAVLLAAFAGTSLRRPRRGEREVRVAPATLTGMRAQRAMRPRGGRRR